MAKKSNKTAHVLNLLSGHDAAQEAEGSSMEEEFSGEEDGQAPASALAEPKPSDSKEGTAVSQPNPAPVKASAASQNNISLIDTTGDDPVADLIQEKLSSEFEKQMQESQAEDSDTPKASPGLEPSSPADEKIYENSAEEENVVSGTGFMEEESVVSGTDFMEEESVVSDTDFAAEEKTVSGSHSAGNEDAASDTGSVEDQGAASDSGSAEDQGAASDTGSAEAEDAVSDSGSPEEEKNVPDSGPAETEPIAEAEADLGSEPEAAEQKASKPQPAAAPEPEPEPDFAAVNVMERIVHDKIIYFMRQFDVCTCDRCKADVVALTLNGLMPKYIVTMPAAVDPLISYYTNRLISDVTVEATKACMTVKENPRH